MRTGDTLILPGLASAHSHAFQRAMRGRAQGISSASARASEVENFWSWRSAMYKLASHITPEQMLDLCEFAFSELALLGVTAVGEFHYLHHNTDGNPYDSRTIMSDAVIEAAKRVGIRVCLLRVLYERAGAGAPPEGAQRRFSDTDIADAFADAETLLARYKDQPLVRIGIAPHSVRAVSRSTLEAAASFAQTHQIPMHMHLSEQPKEIEACLAEHAMRPVELAHACGATELASMFSAVHATHLSEEEPALLSGCHAVICRSTERDLGDGAPNLSALLSANVHLAIGVDSHAMSDPFVDLRAMELDERTRTGQRQVALGGPELLEAGSAAGYRALGFGALGSDSSRPDSPDSASKFDANQQDEVHVDLSHARLVGSAGLGGAALLDQVMFSTTGDAVSKSVVAGQDIELGANILRERAQRFEAAVKALFE